MPVASMPMYDFPELRGSLGGLWAGMARHCRRQGLGEVPDRLCHETDLDRLWSDPGLLLSQCCGYDLVRGHAGRLRPLATPRYTAPGCSGSDYASHVVVAETCPATDLSELRGRICAVNSLNSHSGYNSLKVLLAPMFGGDRLFAGIRISGSHAESLAMIRRGEADTAAIDCVTFALLKRCRPDAVAGIRIIGRTGLAPGIPYVTRASLDEDLFTRLRQAILDAFEDPDLSACREALFLGGAEDLPADAYLRISEAEDHAASLGCADLR